MSGPHLRVVAIDEISAATDLFVCRPYDGIRLMAQACLRRQGEARRSHRPGVLAPDHLRRCASCVDGPRVAEQIGAPIPEPSKAPSSATPMAPRRPGQGRSRGGNKCTTCGQPGHDRRTCGRPA